MKYIIDQMSRIATAFKIAALAALVAALLTGMSSQMDTNMPIKFRLKEPTEYFSNPHALALLKVALSGDSVKASELAAMGADPNEEGPTKDANANRLRPLHYAIASNNPQAVKILLKAGADPELRAQHNGTAYLFAITLNNIDMLSLLLASKPVEALDGKTLRTLMFESVIQHRIGCLELLLKRGAPIDLPDSADYTIFMRAIDSENFDLAEHLLELGAAVNIEPASGVTPGFQVQRMLGRFEPGTETYMQLQRIQQKMAARGVSFPVKSPAEIRAARAH